MESIYKEFYEVSTDKEVSRVWAELKAKGYHGSEIYIATYTDKFGKFHRQVFVFAD